MSFPGWGGGKVRGFKRKFCGKTKVWKLCKKGVRIVSQIKLLWNCKILYRTEKMCVKRTLVSLCCSAQTSCLFEVFTFYPQESQNIWLCILENVLRCEVIFRNLKTSACFIKIGLRPKFTYWPFVNFAKPNHANCPGTVLTGRQRPPWFVQNLEKCQI